MEKKKPPFAQISVSKLYKAALQWLTPEVKKA